MSQSALVGSRIRERRVMLGLKQSELARKAGISPSYLNLIEHNRRRIGGKTLLTLADLLNVEPAILSEGAEAALLSDLHEAVSAEEKNTAEVDRTEEFAGRFPGWARVVVTLAQKRQMLEQSVKTLTDRLSNDPHLAASLHDVISTVTAIRSTASILVDTKTLEPEWQARFHRNINEDSRRLAEGAEALVKYLEGAPDTEEEVRSPLDEMHVFLAEHDYAFPELEQGAGDLQIKDLVAEATSLKSDGARDLSEKMLRQYKSDAQELPLERLELAVDKHGLAPQALAREIGVGLPLMFRRMASLPQDVYGPVGLVSCDMSGTILFRKPLPGFNIPAGAGACTLWPLFRALLSPLTPVVQPLLQIGRDQAPIESYSMAEAVQQGGFDSPALHRAHMLLLPGRHRDEGTAMRVGASCRICPVPDCRARRELSLLTEEF